MEVDALVQPTLNQVFFKSGLVSTFERGFRDERFPEELVAIRILRRYNSICLAHCPQIDALVLEFNDEATYHLILESRNLPLATELPRSHHSCLAVDLDMASEDPFEEDRQDFGVYVKETLAEPAASGKLC